MAANMEPFLNFLISIGFLPIRQGEDGVWRRDLLSLRFLAQLVIFLSTDACYLYSMWDRLVTKGQTIAVFTSLTMQVIEMGYFLLKDAVSRDFLSLFIFMNRTHLGP